VITKEWIIEAAGSADANRRVLAAIGERLYPEDGTGILQKLLQDSHPAVSSAAMRTAAALQNRAYLDGLLSRLAHAPLRGVAIEALASFGDRIVGTLGDVLLDDTMPLAVRRQIPRVLRNIPHQRSVDVLLESLALQDLTVRSAVLKALNKLRETHPKLAYGRESVFRHIWNEARYYYQINAALAPFRDKQGDGAARLLAATLNERLRSTLERLFRLLGLRYPPREIHAAYLAVNRRRSEEFTAAIEFLDNILEPELKKVLLPLLDDDVRVSQRARELFGIEDMDARGAVRELLRSGDSWLVACAIATAAELDFRDLAPDIVPLGERAGTEVGQVAKSALAAFAS
jgi:AAA family ATP:ADP antiporter